MSCKCPVCNGTNLISSSSYSRSINEGIAYLSAIPQICKKDISTWKAEQEVLKCEECDTHFIFPWFNSQEAYTLFQICKPIHNAGWVQLEQCLKNRSKNTYLDWILQVCNHWELNKEAGCNYAEFGCPFSGYSLAVSYDKSKKWKLHNLNSLIFPQQSLNSLDHILKAFHHLISPFVKYGMFSNRQGRQKDIPPLCNSTNTIISDTSIYRWGENCNRYNQNCLPYSLKTNIFKKVTTLDSLNPEDRFDWIGAFNVLDHTENVLNKIIKMFEHTNVFVFTTHTSINAGYQHKFVFGDQFCDYLKLKLSKHFENDFKIVKIHSDDDLDYAVKVQRE